MSQSFSVAALKTNGTIGNENGRMGNTEIWIQRINTKQRKEKK